MKLLYITSKPAYPSLDGGCMAIKRFLDALIQGGHDITHLTFETHKHPFYPSEWPEEIKKSIDLHSIFIDTKIKPLRMLAKTLCGNSYHLSRFRTPDLCRKISQLVQSKSFDAIVFDGLYSAACLHDLRLDANLKIYIRTHNVEHEIWNTLAKNSRSAGKSFITRILAQALKKDEIKILNQVNGLFSISPEDTKKFIALGIKSTIVDLPVSIDISKPSEPSASNSFFFIGGIDWIPNKEALHFLISEIFPQIKAKIPSAELHIAGIGTDQLKVGEGIKCHGFVPDSIAFMRESGTLLLPLKSGSGVRIKILEAMSIGVPIVTTSIGKEGINALECMSIADTTDAFIKASIVLQDSIVLKEKYAKNSRDYIQANYSSTSISTALNEILH
jgi:glycosyltransferase involved in cell wall biosynthesis